MKKILCFLAISLVLISCSANKKNVTYKAIVTGYNIEWMQVISRDTPTGKYVYPTQAGTQELSYEWTDYRDNRIEIRMQHDTSLGAEGTIKVYAGNKIIGEAIGGNPILVIQNWKK